jgi:hypothetical protein
MNKYLKLGLISAGSAALVAFFASRRNNKTGKRMTTSVPSNMFAKAAKELGVEEAALRAVAEVESGNMGFYANTKKPIVRLENHVLVKYQPKYNVPFKSFGINRSGIAEYNRFLEAYNYQKDSAIESTSFGQFQIMGFHWKSLGYKSPQDFFAQMSKNAESQFDAFVRFLVKNNLVKYLKTKNWSMFAYYYNGAGYAKNAYDVKMANAYEKWKKQLQ